MLVKQNKVQELNRYVSTMTATTNKPVIVHLKSTNTTKPKRKDDSWTAKDTRQHLFLFGFCWMISYEFFSGGQGLSFATQLTASSRDTPQVAINVSAYDAIDDYITSFWSHWSDIASRTFDRGEIHDKDKAFVVESVNFTYPYPQVFSQEKMQGGSYRVCDECASTVVPGAGLCGKRVQKYLEGKTAVSDSALLKQVQIDVGTVKAFRICNSTCHPSVCFPVNMGEQPKVAVDAAAPRIRYAVTPNLVSIPTRFKVPRDVASLQEFITSKLTSPDQFLLHTSSPSIIKAPESIRAEIKNAVYLSAFRVSPKNGCGIPEYEGVKKHEGLNFLGLAIMDRYLNILKEVVLDVNTHIKLNPEKGKLIEDSIVNPKSFVFDAVQIFEHEGFLYLSNRANKLLPVRITTKMKDKRQVNEFNIPVLDKGSASIKLYSFRQFEMKFGTGEEKGVQIFQDTAGDTILESWAKTPHRTGRLGDFRTNGTFNDNIAVSAYEEAILVLPEPSYQNSAVGQGMAFLGGKCLKPQDNVDNVSSNLTYPSEMHALQEKKLHVVSNWRKPIIRIL